MDQDGTVTWTQWQEYLDRRFDRLEARMDEGNKQVDRRLRSLEESRAEDRGRSSSASSFWRRVRELDLLVFAHPYYTGVKQRMERYYMTNLIGNPLDTALAVADVCFSGILEEIPGLKFFFAHGGGFMPYQVGRLRHGFSVRSESKVDTQRSPELAFQELYFDTITHDAPTLRYLVQQVSAEHVFLGTDLPFDMADVDPLATVAAAPPCSPPRSATMSRLRVFSSTKAPPSTSGTSTRTRRFSTPARRVGSRSSG